MEIAEEGYYITRIDYYLEIELVLKLFQFRDY